MSGIDYDKFNLDELSLEEIEPAKKDELSIDELEQAAKHLEAPSEFEAEQVIQAAPPPVVEEIEIKAPAAAPQPAEAAQAENQNVPEGSMACPKCQHVQPIAEQCVSCGVYVKKAMAAQSTSKIQITHTKF